MSNSDVIVRRPVTVGNAIIVFIYCAKCDQEMQPVRDRKTHLYPNHYTCPVCGVIEMTDIAYPATRMTQ